MDNGYKYFRQSLTSSMAQELIQELFTGKTAQKQEIIRTVDETHRERGGHPAMSSHHPVTRALSVMKRSGLAQNPRLGFWIILSSNKTVTQITTLNEFMEWARNFERGEYVFRGVPNEEYKIEASAFRRPKEADRDFEKFLQINRDLIREARLHGYDVKDGQKLKDLEILAEAQHFEAATCLIDFTYNALIALLFACQPDSKTSQDSPKFPNGKVFVVQNKPPGFKEVTPELLEKQIDYFFQHSEGTESQLPEPLSKQLYQWQPRQQNNRILAQQSIFLFGNSHFDADAECVILEYNKQNILTELQQVSGITKAMLFPDFDGFTRYLYGESILYTKLGASQYRERADREFQRGEYELAIADYDEAIKLDPNDAYTYYRRGLVWDWQEQYEEAIADYGEAIDRKPEDYTEFYQARGRANFALKRYTLAINDYNEAIRLFPKDINSFYYRGLAKASHEQYEAAIADYDEAIRLSPRHAEIYRWRGFAKFELGQYVSAIADYDEAIRIYPGDRKSHYQRGLANFELEEYELAISDYDKAISLSHPLNMDPHDAYVYYQRALGKKELDRFEEARDDLQTAFPLAMRTDEISDSQLAVIIDDLLREINLHLRGTSEDE